MDTNRKLKVVAFIIADDFILNISDPKFSNTKILEFIKKKTSSNVATNND